MSLTSANIARVPASIILDWRTVVDERLNGPRDGVVVIARGF